MADWYVSSAAYAAIPQFVASASYTVGQIIKPTAPALNAQYCFNCTVAGAATTEPTWPTTNNATVVSGGATFQNISGQAAFGWSAAAGNLLSLSTAGAGAGRYVLGDRVFLSSDHSESITGFTYGNAGGAAFGIVQFISVNRAGSVPPVAADQVSGAAITNTSGSLTLDPICSHYYQGITITLGGTTTQMNIAATGLKVLYLKNCAIVFTTSNTTAFIQNNSTSVKCIFDNTSVTFNNAGQRFIVNTVLDFHWINTPAAVQGTVPTILFQNASLRLGTVVCRGIDLSAVNTTLAYSASNNSFQKILLDSCRINPAVARLGTTTYVNSCDEVELINCFDGTNILSERYTPAGAVTTDTLVTMQGGASDNVGLFSHRMQSSVRSDFLALTLDSFWLDINNTGIGVSHTATVELISNLILNNNDVVLKLGYEGTSGSSLASFSDSFASPLTPVAALPASSVTWTNTVNVGGTPTPQHLQVTFTAQQAGRLRGQVRLGKPSTTLWINPQITVT